mmetsp:Transcript_56174/g.162779  ORF Transcript_56174/g.162779 Transcript_56174/m.162779 type:complete len:471 (+) Transcript_56174:169-1581(+)
MSHAPWWSATPLGRWRATPLRRHLFLLLVWASSGRVASQSDGASDVTCEEAEETASLQLPPPRLPRLPVDDTGYEQDSGLGPQLFPRGDDIRAGGEFAGAAAGSATFAERSAPHGAGSFANVALAGGGDARLFATLGRPDALAVQAPRLRHPVAHDAVVSRTPLALESSAQRPGPERPPGGADKRPLLMGRAASISSPPQAMIDDHFARDVEEARATSERLLRRSTKLRDRLELVSQKTRERYQQRTRREQHTRLIIMGIVVAAFMSIAVLLCACPPRRRKSLRARHVSRSGASDNDVSTGKHKRGESKRGESIQDALSQTKFGMRIWYCLFRCCGVCCVSWETLLQMSSFLVLYAIGFAGLWHYGLIQPFLRQLVVYIYVVAGVLAILMAVLYEIWASVKAALDEAQGAIRYMHDKVDHVSSMIGVPAGGFDENESLDGSQASAVDGSTTLHSSQAGRGRRKSKAQACC